MFAIRFFSMYGYGWRLCTLLLMCLLGSNIAAHEGRPIHLQLEQQTPQRFELRWRIPPVLSDIQLPEFSLEGCRLIRPDSLQPRFAGRRQYQCEAEKTANNVADTRPKAVTLVYPLANPVLSVLLQYRWLNGDSNTLLVGPSERRIQLPETLTVADVAVSYLYTGVEHILEGLDHLLFVSCLLMIILFGVSTAASPLALKALISKVLLTVTGFTLGHSLTLALVTLAGFSAPSRLVETLIAFSIMLMALEIAQANRASWTFRYPATVATAFGLLHGLGFAGALQEIGLPYQQEILALVFFNLGVELGQLVFVAALCLIFAGLYALWAFHAQYKRVLWPDFSWLKFTFSRGVGSLSAYWVVVRFLEL